MPAWVKTPIDAFILRRPGESRPPTCPAPGPCRLLRRVTFDLTGLPPTREELDDFLADTRPDAYERVVDRLLASPHFGEHWAQHWLDVVRYAESNGYEADTPRPHAWRYRDYVVRSFNEDMPYNRFVTEQIAGDLLAASQPLTPMPTRRRGARENAEAELLIAAGLHRCGPVHLTSGNIDPAVARQEVLTEITNGVAAAFLGLTMGCARCHDHKFDPISQARLLPPPGVLRRPSAQGCRFWPRDREKAEYDRLQCASRKPSMAPLRKQIANLERLTGRRSRRPSAPNWNAAYREALDTPVNKRTPRQVQLAAHAQMLLKITWDEVVDALSPADRDRRLALRRQLHELEAQQTAAAGPGLDRRPTTVLRRALPSLRRGDPKKTGALVVPDVSARPRQSTPVGRRRDRP